jgi:MFS family permease
MTASSEHDKLLSDREYRHEELNPRFYHFTVDEAFDFIGFGNYQWFAIIILGTSMACEGMEIVLFFFIQECIMIEWGVSTLCESILTASAILGQIVGLLGCGLLADSIGRKNVIIFGWMLIVVFGLLSAASTGFLFLTITRTLVGIGIGASEVVSYDLCAEILPTKYRGKLIYLALFNVLGNVYVISLCWLILGHGNGWRYIVLAVALPIIPLVILGTIYLHESPRWLIIRRRIMEAEANLNSIARFNGIIDDAHITLKHEEAHFGQTEESNCEIFTLFQSEPRNIATITSLVWIVW